MRIDQISSQNFMSHKETLLNLRVGRRINIAGENGSGKTSASVDSLLWALFGKARSSTTDQVKGPWGMPTRCEVGFHVKGHDYTVVRQRGSGSQLSLCNETAGLDLSEKHIALTQAKIEDLVGSYGSFVNTATFRQGDALRFAVMRPEERRTLFEELLDLQIYASIETKSNKGKEAARQAIASLDQRIPELQADQDELARLVVEQGREQYELDKAQSELDDEQASLDSASGELLQMEEASKQRNRTATQVSDAERQHYAARAVTQRINAELARLLRIDSDLAVSICPTCKRELNRDEIERQQNENAKKRSELIDQQTEAEQKEAETAVEWKRQERLLRDIDTEIANRFKHARDLQSYSQSRLPPLQRRVNELRSSVDRRAGQITELERKVGVLPDLHNELEEEQARLRGYGLISEAFSKRGIPRELMRNFASEVEKATNALLQALGGATVEIKLDKEGATKHGVTEGTVDVWFTDGGPTRKVEMLSGGEKMRAMTALRLGIWQAMARRTDRPLRTLILDESMDGLDQRGKDDLMMMLQALDTTHFDRMLLITHDPAVAGLFPDRIELAKGSDGASMVL